jgi:hypothetical protein
VQRLIAAPVIAQAMNVHHIVVLQVILVGGDRPRREAADRHVAETKELARRAEIDVGYRCAAKTRRTASLSSDTLSAASERLGRRT